MSISTFIQQCSLGTHSKLALPGTRHADLTGWYTCFDISQPPLQLGVGLASGTQAKVMYNNTSRSGL